MRAGIGRTSLGVSIASIALLAGAWPALAQDAGSVNDYRLPDPTRTSAPRPAGPVDPENPYSTPVQSPRSQPAPTPSPTPAPTPTPTQSAAPRIVLPPPSTTATRSARTPEPTPSATALPSPEPTRIPPVPAPSLPAEAAPLPSLSPSAAPVSSPSPSPQPAAEEEGNIWPIVAGLTVLVLAGGAFVFTRRRRNGQGIDEERASLSPTPADPTPVTAAPAPPSRSPSPPAAPLPAAAAKPKAVQPPVSTSAAIEPLTLAVGFAPQAIRLSLVYATVQYALELTNTGAEPLPALQVRGDLSSAHASLDTRTQLVPDPQALEAQHQVAALAPGETLRLTGEVRVPLQVLRTVQKGTARFFVPLARFCILAPDGTMLRRVFTLGPRDAGGGAIASVRLDAGPRNLRELDAREIEAARAFALAPVAAHG